MDVSLSRLPGGRIFLVLAAGLSSVLLIYDLKLFLVFWLACLVGPVIWWRPEVGLFLTVAAIPLEILGVLTDPRFVVAFSVAKLLGLLTLGAWAVRALIEKRRLVLYTTEVVWLGAFILFAAVSVSWAPSKAEGAGMVLRLVSFLVLYVLMLNLVTTRESVNRVVIVVMVSTFLVAALGIVQPLLGEGVSQTGWRFETENVLAPESDSTEEETLGNLVRVTGTMVHTDAYAGFLAMLLPVFFFGLEARRQIWARAAVGVMLGTCLAALVLTYSRMGAIAFALGLCLLVAFKVVKVTPPRMGLAVLLGTIAVLVLPVEFLTRVFSPDHYMRSLSIRARVDFFWASWRIIAEHWLTGVGFFNIREFMAQEVSYLGEDGGTAHNMYLTLWAETGAVGLLLYLGFLGATVSRLKAARRNFRKVGDTPMMKLAATLEVSVLVLVACNFVMESYGIKGWWPIFALGAAVARLSVPAGSGLSVASSRRGSSVDATARIWGSSSGL